MIIWSVFLLLWYFKCLTFSRKTTLGFLAFIIFSMVKTRVPRVSSNPFFFPEILNGWQGKPAQRISWLGIDWKSILVISPWGVSPKLALYVSAQSLSISEENKHLPSSFSKARRKPPMPANKSTNVNFLFFLALGITKRTIKGELLPIAFML